MFRNYISKLAAFIFAFLFLGVSFGKSYAIKKVDLSLLISELEEIKKIYEKDLSNLEDEYRNGKHAKDDYFKGLDSKTVNKYIEKNAKFILERIKESLRRLYFVSEMDEENFSYIYGNLSIGRFWREKVFFPIYGECFLKGKMEYVKVSSFPINELTKNKDKKNRLYVQVCFGELKNGKAYYLMSVGGKTLEWEDAFFVCF